MGILGALGLLGEGRLGMLEGELLLDGMLGMLTGDGRLGGGVIGAQAVNNDPIKNGIRACEGSRRRDL